VAYSADLAPPDYYLLSNLKERKVLSIGEVTLATALQHNQTIFFWDGLKKLEQ
jgi:hypothetical protein